MPKLVFNVGRDEYCMEYIGAFRDGRFGQKK
ncbi:5-methyltetrahydrofolate--homocysteine methyltransferase [Desulfitobacterium sp. LBE]|nr:5-methyltetrahydrofolate--homocysteine methyltransferase [Desulfitobacterium sp. LBE]